MNMIARSRGQHVLCFDCAAMSDADTVGLYADNVGHYGQDCHHCGATLVEPLTDQWPILFDRRDCLVCSEPTFYPTKHGLADLEQPTRTTTRRQSTRYRCHGCRKTFTARGAPHNYDGTGRPQCPRCKDTRLEALPY